MHAHLIRGTEAAAIKAHHIPLVMTLQILAPALAPGVADPAADHADLLIACSKAVAADAARTRLRPPVRVVWNGIAEGNHGALIGRDAEENLRERLGWKAGDFVIISAANLRPQKRLERLPEIVARLRDALAPRAVRLALVGAHHGGPADAARAELEAAIDRWKIRDQRISPVRWRTSRSG